MLSNPQLKTNRFHFQYAFLCHFAEVYFANVFKSPNQKPIASLSNTSYLVTSQKSISPMRSNFQSKTNRFHFQYAFLSDTQSFVTSQKSIPPMLTNSPIKNQSPQLPIRLHLSLRRSLLRQCVQIPR
jgi:hypothetical protein